MVVDGIEPMALQKQQNKCHSLLLALLSSWLFTCHMLGKASMLPAATSFLCAIVLGFFSGGFASAAPISWVSFMHKIVAQRLKPISL